MSELIFKSKLGSFIQLYLSQRKELRGKESPSVVSSFRDLDRFLYSNTMEKTFVDYELYKSWLDSISGQKKGTVRQKIGDLRQFCRFMTGLGIECYLPPAQRFLDDFVPYIFSHEEIASLFKAADRLRLRNYQTRATIIGIPALFRLLYSTGIRIGEALVLKNSQIDFSRHIIIINDTKNGAQRYAPLNSSMESTLKEYILSRNKLPVAGISDPDKHLFVSGCGTPVSHCAVHAYFQKILSLAGIKKRDHCPRIHDLRHTCCVHAFVRMVRSGKDPNSILPVLAAFMGHKKTGSTEHYIRLTCQLYPDILNSELNETASINMVITNKIDKVYEDN